MLKYDASSRVTGNSSIPKQGKKLELSALFEFIPSIV